MSLARAFTIRRNRGDKPSAGFLGRTVSQRTPNKIAPSKVTILHTQISAPINLISSTNVLSFEAPDILGTVPTPHAYSASSDDHESVSSRSSRSSGEHSDASSTSVHSRDTLTDASSVGDSTPGSPELNHLSCYFKPSVYTDIPSRSSSLRSSSHKSSASFDAPAIPQRAASHSKKAHMHVSRQRSISRARSPPSTTQELTRDSADFFRPEPAHPFVKELEQLNEVAEEFSSVARDAEADADQMFMEANDLGYFCATDYMMEIQDMLHTVFEEENSQAGWI